MQSMMKSSVVIDMLCYGEIVWSILSLHCISGRSMTQDMKQWTSLYTTHNQGQESCVHNAYMQHQVEIS